MTELEWLTQESYIVGMSYWEHFKYEKDMALVYPPEHPKRIAVHKQTNELLAQWTAIKNKIDSIK